MDKIIDCVAGEIVYSQPYRATAWDKKDKKHYNCNNAYNNNVMYGDDGW